MIEINRERPLFNVNKDLWKKHNCVYCKNTKTCDLYRGLQKKIEPEDFTATTFDCPYLRY